MAKKTWEQGSTCLYKLQCSTNMLACSASVAIGTRTSIFLFPLVLLFWAVHLSKKSRRRIDRPDDSSSGCSSSNTQNNLECGFVLYFCYKRWEKRRSRGRVARSQTRVGEQKATRAAGASVDGSGMPRSARSIPCAPSAKAPLPPSWRKGGGWAMRCCWVMRIAVSGRFAAVLTEMWCKSPNIRFPSAPRSRH